MSNDHFQLDVHPHQLRKAAQEVDTLRRELAEGGTRLGRVPDEIRGQWTGEAADASIPEMRTVAHYLHTYGPQLQAVHDALVSLAADYETAQAHVATYNRQWAQADSTYDAAVQQAASDYQKAYDGAKGTHGAPPNRAIIEDLQTSSGTATSSAAVARDRTQQHLTAEFTAARQHLFRRTQHCGEVISTNLPLAVAPVCGPSGLPPVDDHAMLLGLPLAATYRLKDAATEADGGEKEGGEEEASTFDETFEALKVSLFDIRDWQATIFGGIGYANHYVKGAGSLLEQGETWEEAKDGWRMTQEVLEGKNWEELLRGGMTDAEITPGMARAAGIVGKAGKVLGPLGVAGGIFVTAKDFTEGHDARAAYDLVTTAIGTVALFTPPPFDLALGGVVGAMTGAELLYDHVPAVKHVVDTTVDDVKDAVGSTVNAVSSVGHALGSLF